MGTFAEKIVNVNNKPHSIIHPCPRRFRVTSQAPSPHPSAFFTNLLQLLLMLFYRKIIPSGVNILGFSGRVRSCLHKKRTQNPSKAHVLAIKFANRVKRHKQQSSDIAKHYKNEHGTIPQDLLTLFEVLKKCRNKFDCLVYEMLFIRILKPNLNAQSDSIRVKVFS